MIRLFAIPLNAYGRAVMWLDDRHPVIRGAIGCVAVPVIVVVAMTVGSVVLEWAVQP